MVETDLKLLTKVQGRLRVLGQPIQFDQSGRLSDQIEEVILVIVWINRNQCVLECGFDVIRTKGVQFGRHTKSPRNNRQKVVLQSDAAIPARVEAFVSRREGLLFKHQRGQLWSLDPRAKGRLHSDQVGFQYGSSSTGRQSDRTSYSF